MRSGTKQERTRPRPAEVRVAWRNVSLPIDAFCVGEECKGSNAQRLTQGGLCATKCHGDSINARRLGAHKAHHDDLVQLESQQVAGRGPKVRQPLPEQTETFCNMQFTSSE